MRDQLIVYQVRVQCSEWQEISAILDPQRTRNAGPNNQWLAPLFVKCL